MNGRLSSWLRLSHGAVLTQANGDAAILYCTEPKKEVDMLTRCSGQDNNNCSENVVNSHATFLYCGRLLVVMVSCVIGGCVTGRDTRWMADVHELSSAIHLHDAHTALKILESNPGVVHDNGKYFQPPNLHAAVAGGNLTIVRMMLDHGARIDLRDREYRLTPLFYARNEKMVDLLLSYGADREARAYPTHMTPLMFMAVCCPEMAARLIHRGANVGARDRNGWTALHYAVREGRESTVALLLDAGADTKAVDKDGLTPVALAVATGQTKLVPLFH